MKTYRTACSTCTTATPAQLRISVIAPTHAAQQRQQRKACIATWGFRTGNYIDRNRWKSNTHATLQTASASVNCLTPSRTACTHHKINRCTRRIGELPVAARTRGGAACGYSGTCTASRQAGRNFRTPAASRRSRSNARRRRRVTATRRIRAHCYNRHGAAEDWNFLNDGSARENRVDRRKLRGGRHVDLSVQNHRAAAHTCDLN